MVPFDLVHLVSMRSVNVQYILLAFWRLGLLVLDMSCRWFVCRAPSISIIRKYMSKGITEPERAIECIIFGAVFLAKALLSLIIYRKGADSLRFEERSLLSALLSFNLLFWAFNIKRVALWGHIRRLIECSAASALT